MEIGAQSQISSHRRNTTPVERPSDPFEVAHMDIGFGDSVAPGGVKYALLIVDRFSRKGDILGLKDVKGASIKSQLIQYKLNNGGRLPRLLYTDFDPKLISGEAKTYLAEQGTVVRAAPPRRQHQNGLFERAWQTLYNMARAFITDCQLPKYFWYWVLRHAT